MEIEDYERQFQPVFLKRTENFIKQGMIQFDEETAGRLAGPFEGNFAYFLIQDCSKNSWMFLNSEELLKSAFRFSYHHFPFGAYRSYAKNEEQLQARLAKLNKKQRKHWEESQKQYHQTKPSVEKPISFKIYGNDDGNHDASYAKFYQNETEALAELELFLSMQPINYYLHVSENGFVFTN